MTEISKARGRAGEFVNLFGNPMRTQPEFLETNGQSLRPLTERLRAEGAIFEGD